MKDSEKIDNKGVTPPEFLREKGIERVTDNREGRAVSLPKGTLFLFFGEELKERYLRKPTPWPDSSG